MDLRAQICPAMCRYHKPGKVEDPGCGGLEWLLARPEAAAPLPGLAQAGRHLAGLDAEDPRLWVVCRSCEFRVDGCDFRDPAVPDADCEPCGGLKAVALLLANGLDVGL